MGRNPLRGKQMAIIQGKVEWAKVHKPDTKFKPVYEITVVLTKEQARQLKDAGLKADFGEDGNYRVRFRKSAEDKDGNKIVGPRVVDRNNKPFNEPIGNGSTCVVQYYTKDWTFKGRNGTKGILQAVKILDLIPYKSKSDEEFEAYGLEEDVIDTDDLDMEMEFDDE